MGKVRQVTLGWRAVQELLELFGGSLSFCDNGAFDKGKCSAAYKVMGWVLFFDVHVFMVVNNAVWLMVGEGVFGGCGEGVGMQKMKGGGVRECLKTVEVVP